MQVGVVLSAGRAPVAHLFDALQHSQETLRASHTVSIISDRQLTETVPVRQAGYVLHRLYLKQRRCANSNGPIATASKKNIEQLTSQQAH